jgi:hypothetical protein
MKELIILGMGPTRSACTFDADEVWGVNNGYRQVKELNGKLDKLFICHRGQEWDYVNDPVFDWEEQQALVNQGVELVSLFKLKHVKPVTLIPFKAMVKKFGTDYYSDSIAYMVAYAIHLNTRINSKTGLLKLKEPMRIRMYGVDMHTKDEYATERGGIEYYVAVARTLGVDFWIHPDSSVCKNAGGVSYGWWDYKTVNLDPAGILELQQSEQGIQILLQRDYITEEEAASMIQAIRDNPNMKFPKIREAGYNT